MSGYRIPLISTEPKRATITGLPADIASLIATEEFIADEAFHFLILIFLDIAMHLVA
jgi:hypothetical protein